ncbi:MAG: hypothetical protein HC927_11425 [Deltaproteobacteria bacterium]|nr:hypothetical protein [Deltaproteobacteria bacterium]
MINELAAFYTEHGLDASKLLRYTEDGQENASESEEPVGNRKPVMVAA